jgi:hypothetical protein
MIDCRRELAHAFKETDLPVDEFWARYVSSGGEAGRYETDAYLSELMSLSTREHNILALVINESLQEKLSQTRAPLIDPRGMPS